MLGSGMLAGTAVLGGAGGLAKRTPALFLAHGAPMLLDMPEWVEQLGGWADELPRPSAILMISAHWESRPVTIGATTTVPLVYDFYGFPQKYYEQKYAAPGAPHLARRIRDLVRPTQPVADDPARGLDHGAYVPLVAMYPEADLPTLQLSLPSMDPKELFALGQQLAPLRDEGVLIIGSGFIVHNLRAMRQGPPPSWATDFDSWTADVLARGDVDALLDYRKKAPGVERSLPTHEHFVPLIVAAGAAGDDRQSVKTAIDGFAFGAMTKRSVQFG